MFSRASIRLSIPRRLSLMNIPGQVIMFNDNFANDGVESVISFTDDEHSVSLDALESRWDPDESRLWGHDSSSSPMRPQRKGSVIEEIIPAINDLPKLPTRRGTMLISPPVSCQSLLSTSDYPTAPAITLQKLLPPAPNARVNFKGIAPPRFPCRKQSTESLSGPLPRFRDMVKQKSARFQDMVRSKRGMADPAPLSPPTSHKGPNTKLAIAA